MDQPQVITSLRQPPAMGQPQALSQHAVFQLSDQSRPATSDPTIDHS